MEDKIQRILQELEGQIKYLENRSLRIVESAKELDDGFAEAEAYNYAYEINIKVHTLESIVKLIRKINEE